MDELTYDPVLVDQELPRFRTLDPLRPPPAGTAMVLIPFRGDMLIIRHGEPIPHARYGAYQRMLLVDVGEHRLVLDIPLLSADAGFAFRGRVGLICRVADPAEVVSRGIRDVSGALYDHLRWMLRQVARDFDIEEHHEAEKTLNATVCSFTGDTAIRLRNIYVELLVDEDEAVNSGRTIRDTRREIRLERTRREANLAALDERGVEALLAKIMETEGPRAVLEWMERAESAERERLSRAWETVLAHSDATREPWELLDAERDIRNRVLGGPTTPFGGTRPGRLRGSLIAGELTDGRSTPVTDRSPERYVDRRSEADGLPIEPRDTGGPPPDVRPPAGPPEDEPVGDPHRDDAGRENSGRDTAHRGADGDRSRPGAGSPRVSRVRGTSSSRGERR
jgi:hypothetical protein